MQEPGNGTVEQSVLQEHWVGPADRLLKIHDSPEGDSIVVFRLDQILVDTEAIQYDHLHCVTTSAYWSHGTRRGGSRRWDLERLLFSS